MNQSTLAVAMHISAITMINAALDGPPVTVVKLDPPDEEAFVHFAHPVARAVLSEEEMRRQITVAVSGFVAERLFDPEYQMTAFGSSMDEARELAQRCADITKPSWRSECPGYDRQILVDCMVKACNLINENRGLIDSLSAELLRDGELTTDRLQQILAA